MTNATSLEDRRSGYERIEGRQRLQTKPILLDQQLVARTRHNFSNLAPWTDVVFGTYHCPRQQKHELGLPGRPVRSYLGWILRPQA